MSRRAGDGLGRIGGRAKGTPNRISGKAKEVLADIVDNNAGKVQEMLDKIDDPKDFVLLYLKISEFVLPKKAAINVSAEAKASDLRSELESLAESESPAD